MCGASTGPNRRRNVGLASLLACILSAGIWGAGTGMAQQDLPESLRDLFEAGVMAEKAGRLDEAEKDFQSVVLQGGGVAFVRHNLGTIYQQRGDHTRAIAEFRAAIRMQPGFAPSHILLGASLRATGAFPEAIRELERGSELAPREPAAHLELAKVYDQIGDRFGVVNQYQILCALAPGDPEYTYQMAQAYLRLSQWCIKEIRRGAPESARMYEIRAEVLLGQGQAERAIHFYQRAVQVDPSLPGLHLALAQIYLDQNRPGEAQREITQELALVPESVAAKALAGRIASRQGP